MIASFSRPNCRRICRQRKRVETEGEQGPKEGARAPREEMNAPQRHVRDLSALAERLGYKPSRRVRTRGKDARRGAIRKQRN